MGTTDQPLACQGPKPQIHCCCWRADVLCHLLFAEASQSTLHQLLILRALLSVIGFLAEHAFTCQRDREDVPQLVQGNLQHAVFLEI